MIRHYKIRNPSPSPKSVRGWRKGFSFAESLDFCINLAFSENYLPSLKLPYEPLIHFVQKINDQDKRHDGRPQHAPLRWQIAPVDTDQPTDQGGDRHKRQHADIYEQRPAQDRPRYDDVHVEEEWPYHAVEIPASFATGNYPADPGGDACDQQRSFHKRRYAETGRGENQWYYTQEKTVDVSPERDSCEPTDGTSG